MQWEHAAGQLQVSRPIASCCSTSYAAGHLNLPWWGWLKPACLPACLPCSLVLQQMIYFNILLTNFNEFQVVLFLHSHILYVYLWHHAPWYCTHLCFKRLAPPSILHVVTVDRITLDLINTSQPCSLSPVEQTVLTVRRSKTSVHQQLAHSLTLGLQSVVKRTDLFMTQLLTLSMCFSYNQSSGLSESRLMPPQTHFRPLTQALKMWQMWFNMSSLNQGCPNWSRFENLMGQSP